MPLEERFVSAGNTTRYEHVMLGGEVIAQAVQLNSGTVTPYLFLNDRMGMTRKVVNSSNTIVRRVVVDAWGDTNTAAGEIVVDATASPAPSLGWRYPGQYEDPGGVRNNGWRVFVPEIGQYTSPEPLHAMTARKFYGPQAYSYAAARPFEFDDPDALSPTRNSRGERALERLRGLLSPQDDADIEKAKELEKNNKGEGRRYLEDKERKLRAEARERLKCGDSKGRQQLLNQAEKYRGAAKQLGKAVLDANRLLLPLDLLFDPCVLNPAADYCAGSEMFAPPEGT